MERLRIGWDRTIRKLYPFRQGRKRSIRYSSLMETIYA